MQQGKQVLQDNGQIIYITTTTFKSYSMDFKSMEVTGQIIDNA